MTTPYTGLPSTAFWRTAVQGKDPTSLSGLYRKRFDITNQTKIATAGSCFAQHIGGHLRKNGFDVIDREPPPPGMPPELAGRFGYRLYSARHGNIYTVRQLLQLTEEARGKREPKFIWEKDGRYYDALRPFVEPFGLESEEEVAAHRAFHLQRFLKVLRQAEIFIFTLGLTECWFDKGDGTIYPTAPGTVAGTYDPNLHGLVSFKFQEIYGDFVKWRKIAKALNPNIKFLLSVSPVPLAATAGDAHILTAVVHSKSVLRAVAGQLTSDFEDIGYFPSYEVISTPFLGVCYFESDMRSVSQAGVDAAMSLFFSEHGPAAAPATDSRPSVQAKPSLPQAANVVCEEMLLNTFAP